VRPYGPEAPSQEAQGGSAWPYQARTLQLPEVQISYQGPPTPTCSSPLPFGAVPGTCRLAAQIALVNPSRWALTPHVCRLPLEAVAAAGLSALSPNKEAAILPNLETA